jgi:aminoglycoside phosphotransferase (APT) family kinase protein
MRSLTRSPGIGSCGSGQTPRRARGSEIPSGFTATLPAANLLVRDGRLAAVLDFGSSAVGDPACDVVIAWTLLSDSARARFRAELDVDAATWSRGRGWGLWKALITLVGQLERNDTPGAVRARGEIARILADDQLER